MAKVDGEEWPCKAAVMDSPPCKTAMTQLIESMRTWATPPWMYEETEVQRHSVSSQDHRTHEWQSKDLNPHLPGPKTGVKRKIAEGFSRIPS